MRALACVETAPRVHSPIAWRPTSGLLKMCLPPGCSDSSKRSPCKLARSIAPSHCKSVSAERINFPIRISCAQLRERC